MLKSIIAFNPLLGRLTRLGSPSRERTPAEQRQNRLVGDISILFRSECERQAQQLDIGAIDAKTFDVK